MEYWHWLFLLFICACFQYRILHISVDHSFCARIWETSGFPSSLQQSKFHFICRFIWFCISIHCFYIDFHLNFTNSFHIIFIFISIFVFLFMSRSFHIHFTFISYYFYFVFYISILILLYLFHFILYLYYLF